MAKAYSLDLRQKVISFIAQGGRKREAAKIFGIGEDTVYRWLRRHKSGTLVAKKRTHFPTKVPLERLVHHVKEHGDHTLHEIGKALGLSPSKVWKHLKRLGITRKKRSRFMQSAARKSVPNLKRK
ncbi:MAG: IS630 transposase-related protein [Alphaproteobacteria bacterium]